MTAGHECYHCKQWVDAGTFHDCWTTTEAALTEGLSEELREAWERLRESASALGAQRIYASHNSIMFARKVSYAYVRPKRSFLELIVFLGRTVRAPQVRKAEATSKTKIAHFVQIRHRDEVEAPITDWLAEAYALQDAPAPAKKVAKKAASQKAVAQKAVAQKTAAKKAAAKKTARKSRR